MRKEVIDYKYNFKVYENLKKTPKAAVNCSNLQATGANLCKMKLKWVICGEGDEQASSKELAQWIAMITEKQRIVAKWRHGNTNSRNVIQILKNRALQRFTHFITVYPVKLYANIGPFRSKLLLELLRPLLLLLPVFVYATYLSLLSEVSDSCSTIFAGQMPFHTSYNLCI